MNPDFKIVITVRYDEPPDPSQLLDAVQDNIEEYLSPNGETVKEFLVSVEDQR